jgi:hypothetical protein
MLNRIKKGEGRRGEKMLKSSSHFGKLKKKENKEEELGWKKGEFGSNVLKASVEWLHDAKKFVLKPASNQSLRAAAVKNGSITANDEAQKIER